MIRLKSPPEVWEYRSPDIEGTFSFRGATGRTLHKLLRAGREGIIFAQRHPLPIQNLQLAGVPVQGELVGTGRRLRWWMPDGHGWEVLKMPWGYS